MNIFNVSLHFMGLFIWSSHATEDLNIKSCDQVIFFYEILHRVEQPLTHERWIKIGESLCIDKAFYSLWTEPMARFYQASLQGKLLPKTAFFGVLVKSHHQQMLGLFHFLKYPLEWEHFVQNACWARQHVNPHMFVYAFTMAVLARSPTNGVYMPLIYEIIPRHFNDVNLVRSAEALIPETWNDIEETFEEFKQRASAIKRFQFWEWWNLLALDDKRWYSVGKEIVERIWPFYNTTAEEAPKLKSLWHVADYTRNLINHRQPHQHHHHQRNKEYILSYLTEDSDWNAYWYNVNQLYSFPVEGYNFLYWPERLGEYWFYFLEQYLIRYNMERLSLGLGFIPDFDWKAASIKVGYDSKLSSLNDLNFEFRPDDWSRNEAASFTTYYLKEIHDTLVFMEAAIEAGSLMLRNGTVVNLRDPKSAFYIYEQIRGHNNPHGTYIHSNWYSLAMMYFADLKPICPGQINKNVKANVLLNFETMTRDPFFYVFHQEILKLKKSFEHHLPAYKHEELHVDGIQVVDLNTSELITYFNLFDYDVTNLLRTNLSFKADDHLLWHENIFARRSRLYHKPFELKVKIHSNKIRDVIVRFYLAPKFDEFGRTINLAANRHNFMHLVSEICILKKGENEFSFSYNATFNMETTYKKSTHFQVKLYNVALNESLRNFLDIYTVQSKHCGLNDRLLLPRGRGRDDVDGGDGGLPMQLFVHVLENDDENNVLWWRNCWQHAGSQTTLGYPFDRPILNEKQFFGTNMLIKDVKIKHIDNLRQEILWKLFIFTPSFENIGREREL